MLGNVDSASELKRLTCEELEQLAAEIRCELLSGLFEWRPPSLQPRGYRSDYSTAGQGRDIN